MIELVLDLRMKGRWFETHCKHFIVPLSKTLNPLIVFFNPGFTQTSMCKQIIFDQMAPRSSLIKDYLLLFFRKYCKLE